MYFSDLEALYLHVSSDSLAMWVQECMEAESFADCAEDLASVYGLNQLVIMGYVPSRDEIAVDGVGYLIKALATSERRDVVYTCDNINHVLHTKYKELRNLGTVWYVQFLDAHRQSSYIETIYMGQGSVLDGNTDDIVSLVNNYGCGCEVLIISDHTHIDYWGDGSPELVYYEGHVTVTIYGDCKESVQRAVEALERRE